MAEVTITDIRNKGGAIIGRVLAGESLTVTRSGRPVASLSPLPRSGPDPVTLLDRWRHLPHLDPSTFRQDIDQTIDPSL
ncbi:MAG: type II toxin-antitoxin system prevent-host-death family antitoxin [bacterium]|nr:type II toxin-antitoxin system prevent-host-death family antitoxin [bacterium]MDE0601319.1 type II toxin-antitoxin system prevent-host-death family antitoxin [bacterium]